MRVSIAMSGIPALTDATGHVFPCIVERIQQAGHQVSCVFLLDPARDQASRGARLAWFQAREIQVECIEAAHAPVSRGWSARWRRLTRPSLSELYPWAGQRAALERLLARQRPDVVFLLETYEGLAATHGLTLAPRFALLGDPAHLPAVYRRRMGLLREADPLKAAYHAALERRRLQLMGQLLRGLQGGGAVAAHHAEWFGRQGMPGARYLRNLVPDLAGADWQARRAATPQGGVPKLLLVGDVRATATRAGLRAFVEQTLPRLEELLGPEGFEAHIIGQGALPTDLARRLVRPSVRVRGFVEDLDREYLTAACFVVPTPIELGVRTRIAFAWSFGCCLVAHEANCAGMPELRHQENALTAKDGRALADAIARAIGDPSLRQRLGRAGRETYEVSFHPQAAGAALVAELERVAGEQSRHTEKEAACRP